MPRKSPEERREYAREYYRRNREKWREYAQNNRENFNAQRRQRRAGPDGDKIREYEHTHRRPKTREAQVREHHGRWAVEDLAAMWAAQEGRCYLCGDDLIRGKEDVDHDHACCSPKKSCRICRRGLAHHRCNVIIGWAQDDPARLRRMGDALEAAQLAFKKRQAASAGSNGLLF